MVFAAECFFRRGYSRVNKRFGGCCARPEKSPLLINCHDAKDFLPKVFPSPTRNGRAVNLVGFEEPL